MRLLSIFCFVIFCLFVLRINGNHQYFVQATANECQAACEQECPNNCPDGGCDYPGPGFIKTKTGCIGCRCPVTELY